MNRRRGLWVFLAALAVIVGVATVATQFASGQPDGLEFVAQQQGFADRAEDHTLSGTPLAGYGNDRGSPTGRNVAVSGAVGVAVTLAIGFGVLWLVRAGRAGDPERAPSSGT